MSASHASTARIRPFDEDGTLVLVEPPDRLDAAARLVARGRAPDFAAGARFLAYAQDNEIPLEHFWCWRDVDGVFQAAVLAVPNPGMTAVCFASRPVSRHSSRTPAVIERVVASLPAGLSIAQTLLEPRERAEQEVYRTAGFEDLATLSYMQRPCAGRRPTPPPSLPHNATVEPYNEDQKDEFLDALAASYVGSRDCPALEGLRRPEDILAGHLATGRFDPDYWTLLRLDGRPSGVLCMNPSRQEPSIELIYLGLVPGARGRGLGRALLRRGLNQCEQSEASTITLAVDEANTPAVRLYSKHGFKRLLRRVALIRPLRSR